jgi:hypothetical protein
LMKKLHIFGAIFRGFLLRDSVFLWLRFVFIFQPYIRCSKYISDMEIIVCWTTKCILNKARIWGTILWCLITISFLFIWLSLDVFSLYITWRNMGQTYQKIHLNECYNHCTQSVWQTNSTNELQINIITNTNSEQPLTGKGFRCCMWCVCNKLHPLHFSWLGHQVLKWFQGSWELVCQMFDEIPQPHISFLHQIWLWTLHFHFHFYLSKRLITTKKLYNWVLELHLVTKIT